MNIGGFEKFWFILPAIFKNKITEMNAPENLKYTRDHEWIRIEDEKAEDGRTIATVGITDFAQSELGEIVYVEVDTLNENVEKEGIFGTVEAVKTTSDLLMPVSGEVIEFNAAIDETDGDDPSLINSSPYDDGWIVKIALSDEGELDDLMNAEDYQSLTA